MKKTLITLSTLALFCGIAHSQSIKETDWGKSSNGSEVKLFILKNKNGMSVNITNYGARIVRLFTPDRNGEFADIVLGFDSLKEYESPNPYFGAVVGRYGNRIGDAKFTLDDKEYNLTKNNGENTLHGGFKGFDSNTWNVVSAKTDKTSATLTLSLLSPDGDQGFPGNLMAEVSYTLNNNNELIVKYSATTDKPTVCNLTNHSYFNLAGQGNGSIHNHELIINADKFTPVDKDLIPYGDLKDVEDTPFDFRECKPIGLRIEFDDTQLKRGKGYDHNWVLNKKEPNELTFAARVYEATSGREMIIETTEPGIQFYSGNVLVGEKGKNGKSYYHRYGFCLETQHFPDSPNNEDFPSTTLRPNEKYSSQTIFRFLAH